MTDLRVPPATDSRRADGVASSSTGRHGETGSPVGLRVAYLVNQYPKVSHSFVRREIRALERLGCEVDRVSIRRCTDPLVDPADRKEEGLTHVILERGAPQLLRAVVAALFSTRGRWLRTIRFAWRLGRRSDRGRLRHLVYFAEACVCLPWVSELRIQHVHAHFGTNSAMVAMLLRELGGPTYSFTTHGPEEFDKPQFIALAEKIRRAAFVVAISDFCRSQLYRWIDYADWSKVVTVRCGIDERIANATFDRASTSGKLVCVGRLCEQKGQSLLIEAAARLVADGQKLDLVLVGDGPMRAALEDLVARAGLRGSVRITGWMSESEVLAELATARAMVLPSFAEGLPVVLMESMAVGRPVISTRIAGIPELVRHGVNGWLVTPGSVDELMQAMREALTAPPELLERYGAAGRRAVAALHDIDREAGRLLGHMQRAVASTP
ncbi:MAG: glycosyltransferase [Planctomycetota bacterium]